MKKLSLKKALAQTVELFDPHPGVSGALIPFPEPARLKGEELNGKTMLLGEAVDAFKEVFGESENVDIKVHQEYEFISVYINAGLSHPYMQHSFRAIRYKVKEALQSSDLS